MIWADRQSIAVLVALAALVVGGSVQHAVDQRHAARALYGTQVLSTASRFRDEENRQIALPIARRRAAAFGSLGGNIGNDLGINSENTLNVEAGTGNTAPLTQIAFEVTVSSPYASGAAVFPRHFRCAAGRRPGCGISPLRHRAGHNRDQAPEPRGAGTRTRRTW